MRRTMWFAFIPAGAAALLAAWATAPYVGVTVDSGVYLSVAEGLVDGHVFTMPFVGYDEPFRVLPEGQRVALTQFPPLYPMLIAAVHALGVSLLNAARTVDLLCYFATVALATSFVWKRTGSRTLAGLAGALFLAPDLLAIHSMAWSEAPMILAMVGAIVLVTRFLETNEPKVLMGAGVLAGITALTRFAGVAVIMGLGAGLWFLTTGSVRQRLKVVGTFTGLALAPVVLWFARNVLILGAPSEKTFGWHPPGAVDMIRGIESIGAWIVPGRLPALILGCAIVSLAVVAGVGRLRTGKRPIDPVVHLCITLAIMYLLFVVLVFAFLDQNVSFDTRILSPLQALSVLGVCCHLRSTPMQRRKVEVAIVAVIAALSVGRGITLARDFADSEFVAYTGSQWRSSETLAYAGSLPDPTFIITNAPDPVWLWHSGTPQLLPPLSNLYTGQENHLYRAQLEEIREASRCREALVIFFDKPTRKERRYIHPITMDQLRLEMVHRFDDGEVYSVREPLCTGAATDQEARPQ